jgi:hypothetical protein
VVETPANSNEFGDWLSRWFGGDCDEIRYDHALNENTKYLYSYDSHLFTLKGTHKEDCRIDVERMIAYDEENYTQIDTIYLYEIEE